MSSEPTASQETDSPIVNTWKMLPRWWIIFVLLFLSLAVVVSFFDQATSRIVFVMTTLLGILLLLLRNLWRPATSIAVRALPVLAFVGLLAGAVYSMRVDEMDGNLIPKRWSWRWDPKPDERVAKLSPTESNKSADLSLTSESDFSQFLGAGRDGFVNIELDPDWNNTPPELVWKKEEFGAGHSGFVAVNGFAVTLEQRGTEELVTCYEIESGDLMWSHSETTRHETVPGGVGPRSTPTIYGGRVYSLGGTGILLCLDGATGSVIWRKELQEEIETTPEAEFDRIQWGRAASPVIDNGRVIVPLGLSGKEGDAEKGASLLALDAETGEEIWRNGTHQISYASPIIATLDDVRQILLVCENNVCGFDVESGEQLWEYPWPGNSAANASCSQPVVIDDQRFLVSKGYAHGAALVELRNEGGQWTAEKIWHKRVMKTKFTNAVFHEGHIYGLDDSILACVDLQTGKRKWKRGRYGHGQVLKVGSQLLVQTESGDVALVELNPESFVELARFSPIQGRTWNSPCLFGKTLLVRNGQEAACYRLP